MSRLTTFTVAGQTFAVVPVEALDMLEAERRTNKAPGARLKAAREQAALSQADLATRLEVSQAFVSKAEGGRTAIGEAYVARVLEACGLAPDWTPPKSKARRRGRAGR